MEQEIRSQDGRVAGLAELYDAGSSMVAIELGPALSSLIVLRDLLERTVEDASQRPFIVRVREGSPWVEVSILPTDDVRQEYVIWRSTGALHRLDAKGAVEDEPIWPPGGVG